MSVSNGKVTAPISVKELYSLLGLAPLNGFYDLGYLCGNQHGKTNKWSKRKPVKYGSAAALTNAELTVIDNGRKVGDLADGCEEWEQYALRYAKATKLGACKANGTFTYQLASGFLYLLERGGLPDNDYVAPTPGTDWCRLTDWEGYEHNATQETRLPYMPATQRVRALSSGTAIKINRGGMGRGTGEAIERGGGFIGALITDGTSSFWATETLDEMEATDDDGWSEVVLKFNTYSGNIPAKTYRAYLFLSGTHIETNDLNPDPSQDPTGSEKAVFYSLSNTAYEVELYTSGNRLDAEFHKLEYTDSGKTAMRCVIRVYDYAPGSVTLLNIRLMYVSGATVGGLNGWANLKTWPQQSSKGGAWVEFTYEGAVPSFYGGDRRLRFLLDASAGNSIDLTVSMP